jgi:hypothetical protein
MARVCVLSTGASERNGKLQAEIVQPAIVFPRFHALQISVVNDVRNRTKHICHELKSLARTEADTRLNLTRFIFHYGYCLQFQMY